MMAKRKPDEREMPDFGSLGEEMQEAMAQARRAMADLPPLEELARLQEAMVGLAQMGALTEKMRLVAEQRAELVAELVGEPDWRVEADIEVTKDTSPLMKVELIADFDLERIIEAHDTLSSEEAQAVIAATLEGIGFDPEAMREEMARGRGLAVIRDLNLPSCDIAGVPAGASEELRLTPEANIPLKVSDERELCFEFAPALSVRVPIGEPDWEKADLPDFAPMIDKVCVGLDVFEPGEPFQSSLTVSQEALELALKLAFRRI